MEHFYKKGQNVILAGGHYNNWEMLAVALDSQVKHNIIGIYRPLTNKFYDKKASKCFFNDLPYITQHKS